MTEKVYIFAKTYYDATSDRTFTAGPYPWRVLDTDLQARIDALPIDQVTELTALQGVPAQIAALGSQVVAAAEGLAQYATRALLYADVAGTTGDLARVYDDSTGAYNADYVFTEGSPGTWALTAFQPVTGSTTIAATGLAGFTGSMNSSPTIDVPAASEAEAQAGTITNKAATPASIKQHVDVRRGAPSGVASLGSDSRIPSAQVGEDAVSQHTGEVVVPFVSWGGALWYHIDRDPDGYVVDGKSLPVGTSGGRPRESLPLFVYNGEVMREIDVDVNRRPITAVNFYGEEYGLDAAGLFKKLATPEVSDRVGFVQHSGELFVDFEKDGNGFPISGRTINDDRYSLDSAGGWRRDPLERERFNPSIQNLRYTAITGSYTAMTKANPGVMTWASHPLRTGMLVDISDEAAMTELNGKTFRVIVNNANTFWLEEWFVPGVKLDTSGFGAAATGGTILVRPRYSFITEDIARTVLVIAWEGQSPTNGGNALEVGTDTVVSTTPPYPGIVLMPSGGYEIVNDAPVTGFVDLQEAVHASGTASETTMSGFANNLVRDIEREFGVKPLAVICFYTYKGGTEERKLGPGSIYWERNTRAFQNICDIYRAQGVKVIKYAHVDLGGSAEGNAGPNGIPSRHDEIYEQKLTQVRERDAADRIASGQDKPAISIFGYLRGANEPQLDPWDAAFEPSQHPSALLDLHNALPHIVCDGGNYHLSRGDGTNTYDSIHLTSQSYYRWGYQLHRRVFARACSMDGGPIRLLKRRGFWKNNKSILCVPFAGPVDETFFQETTNDRVTITTLSDTYRGFVAATDNGSGTAVQAVITGLALGGTAAEPHVEVTFSTTLNSYCLLLWGLRKEDAFADASGQLHDGPLGGAVTPFRGATLHTPSDSTHSPDLTAYADYDWLAPDMHRFTV